MPLVKLGDHFAHIQDYLERVPNGIPDILALEHLTVAGDVIFGANVTLKVREGGRAMHAGLRWVALDWGGLNDHIGRRLISPHMPVCIIHRQGTVIIVASEGSVIMVPNGAVLEDCVLSGDLKILSH